MAASSSPFSSGATRRQFVAGATAAAAAGTLAGSVALASERAGSDMHNMMGSDAMDAAMGDANDGAKAGMGAFSFDVDAASIAQIPPASWPDEVVLGDPISLIQFIAVARHHAKVSFSDEYERRVNASRDLVEKWVDEKRVMYGVTTGFGENVKDTIGPEDTEKLQENIILTHSVSVGRPLDEEAVRAMMLMMLQNIGQGYSGVRLEVLATIRDMLNAGVTPYVPGEGSVGYLSYEAHSILVVIGQGKAYFDGELMDGPDAMKAAGISPLPLSSKEGLALVSGTTSATGFAALGLYDLMQAAKTADIVGALSVETLKGVMNAFDPRLMSVRPHEDQARVAENVRGILADSGVIAKYEGSHVQDALSLRCIPQNHGAARKTLEDAYRTIEIEMNSCCDNPIIWGGEGEQGAISGCNADSSYVGSEMDSAAIAACMFAKMSERRNNRIVDENLGGYPWFLIGQNPGLNSGLMIPQYTQAGLINEMRVLSHPGTVDQTPTCGNQEDYVAMGEFACEKSHTLAGKLEYVLAIELLGDYEAQQFQDADASVGSASKAVYDRLGEEIPVMKDDMLLTPHIEFIKELIHSGELIQVVEEVTGALK